MSRPFKVGDKVYYPSPSGCPHILTLKKCNSTNYPLQIYQDGIMEAFTRDGLKQQNHRVPSIFHATEENYELLSKLYNVQFEDPRPTPSQIIEHLLKKQKYVVCLVADCHKHIARKMGALRLIEQINSEGEYLDTNDAIWCYAIPIDLVTGEEITEIPNE